MGATVKGDTIYISKDLAGKITPAERKVLLAHEIYHWQHKDNLRIFLAKIFLFPFANKIQHYLELSADKWAIQKTKDIEAFISLMDKLEHPNPNQFNSHHPTKTERLQLAKSMRGKL